MKQGYTYIENNRLVWNAERKPDKKDFSFDHCKYVKSRYIIVLAEWQKLCVEVENAKKMQPEIGAVSTDGYECIEKSEVMWFVVINEKWEYISPGQKAYIDGRIIVKLEQ